MKRITAILLACLLLIGLAGCASEANLNYDQAVEKLSALKKGIKATPQTHKPDTSWINAGGTKSINELPPIEKYPLSTKGTADIVVEIFSSTEKSNINGSWMEQMAKEFNASNKTVNGKTVAVSIRPIASGLALDYIQTRVYLPVAFSPANEMWGEMIATGIDTVLIEKRLTGNVAGILMEPKSYNTYKAKYGELTMANVVEAVPNGDTVLGHTDPNVSSTGLNILVHELKAMDPSNPFSATVVSRYQEFQKLIPPASPTTAEMIKVVEKGLLNAVIMEAQAWSMEPKVADWVFTPVGVRHDSPLYMLEGNQEEQEVLRLFADFCKQPSSQKAAETFGFNQFNSYQGEEIGLTGQQLLTAQKFWKENKDGGDPIISVLVIDRSGSMDTPDRLPKVKTGLLSSIPQINESNYIGMVSYSAVNKIYIDVPVGKFDAAQQATMAGAIKALSPGGATATNSAMVVALDMATQARKDLNLSNARIRIIVFTDGKTEGDTLAFNKLTGIVNGLETPVYGIFFMPEKPEHMAELDQLSAINEGYRIQADNEDVTYKLIGLFRKEL